MNLVSGLSVTAICLAGLFTATGADALTIEGPFHEGLYGDPSVDGAIHLSGLHFFDPEHNDSTSDHAVLFEGAVMTPGTTVFADASDPDFAKAVGFLTDGRDSWILIGYQPGPADPNDPHADPNSPYVTLGGTVERLVFASDPLGTGGVDLAGFSIDRIGFRFDGVSNDPDGLFSVNGTLFFLPEPEALLLATLALGVLGLCRASQNTSSCDIVRRRAELVPPIARDFGESPLELNLAITCYLLSLGAGSSGSSREPP